MVKALQRLARFQLHSNNMLLLNVTNNKWTKFAVACNLLPITPGPTLKFAMACYFLIRVLNTTKQMAPARQKHLST